MVESVENIVDAIESLRSNPYKDYILPVGSVLASAGVGIFAASFSVHEQERNKTQLANIDLVNQLILIACDIRDNLIALKSNYFYQIDSHPIRRILTIPPIVFNDTKHLIDVSRLSFLHTEKDGSEPNKWLNVLRTKGIIKNYNFLMDMWHMRNRLFEESVHPLISEFHGGKINHEEFIALLGVGKVAELSDVTERALSLTDDLLVEICCFILGFSALAKEKLDKRVSKKYRPCLNVDLPTIDKCKEAVDMVSLIPSLNTSLLKKFLFVAEEDAKQRYEKIYVK